jgi:hypothetical protein
MREVNGNSVREMMEPIFQQAIREKKWFLSTYQGILMSPAELRKSHNEGRLLWGPVNWRLVDPPTPTNIPAEIDRLQSENKRLSERVSLGWSI